MYFIHTQNRLLTFLYYSYVLCILWQVPQKTEQKIDLILIAESILWTAVTKLLVG